MLFVVNGEEAEDKKDCSDESADQLIEDEITLLRRFSDNKQLFKRVQGMFSEEMQKITDEIASCWQNKEWNESTKALHTLKGSAGTMGAIGLAARARELEAQFKSITENNVVDVECSHLLAELVELVELSDKALASLLSNDD